MDDEFWMINLGDFVNVYEAVLKLVADFYGFLDSKSGEERLWATFAVAWFREEAEKIAQKLREKGNFQPLIISLKNADR